MESRNRSIEVARARHAQGGGPDEEEEEGVERSDKIEWGEEVERTEHEEGPAHAHGGIEAAVTATQCVIAYSTTLIPTA